MKKRLVAYFLTIAVGVVFSVLEASPAGKFDTARLAEIAAVLPDVPHADGAGASDRSKWDSLAVSEAGKLAIKNAEKINGEMVPDTPDELQPHP